MAGSFEGLLGLGILSEELALRMKKAVGFRNIAIHEYKSSIGTWSLPSPHITLRTFADMVTPCSGGTKPEQRISEKNQPLTSRAFRGINAQIFSEGADGHE
jgi:hypothetical protein